MIKDLIITPLSIIEAEGGNVMHAMKNSDNGFCGFGEAYFSLIKRNAIKGWKRHREMTLNIVVPMGQIKFILFDDYSNFLEPESYREIILSLENYNRITIPPMIWVGFQGQGEDYSMLVNLANLSHNSEEVDTMKLDKMQYDWRGNN